MFISCRSAQKPSCAELVQKISQELNREEPQSKIVLINAPSGTGKTGVIMDLIKNLIFDSSSKNKVLLCSQSLTSVDELGKKLIELNNQCSWKGNTIEFVRFGQLEKPHPILCRYTLSHKVKKLFEEHNKKLLKEDKKYKALQSKINDILCKENLKHSSYAKTDNESLKTLMDQQKSLKEKYLLRNLDSFHQIMHENTVLRESNVILTTLNDSMNPLMNEFFETGQEGQRIYCNVDNASRCTEPEILQCLKSQVSRLVLVGDTQQLPPSVSSTYAINWGFKRSMLERLYKFIRKQNCSLPAFALTEQHRMRSQISHFPSKYFYGQQLETAADTEERFLHCPLKPVIVYDILTNGVDGQDMDDNETSVLTGICSQLLQVVPKASIGIIVTNQKAASLYSSTLSGNNALRNVKVNTVDNYQGKEKAIIIIACINPSSEDQSFFACRRRMNVAMTRARQCLIVCGHISSLANYRHWAAFMEDAKNHKNVFEVSCLSQIPNIFADSILQSQIPNNCLQKGLGHFFP
ncbi:probable helicase senataxin [Caerostris darwini]|uniref:Probable helicase senataxin n=1 Tax=Caerostris darwini TaxID=1538125 RepID=A0AAV4PW39_9ARAC|nr:probable helicase senataxin [Caerostris darwini]